MVSIVYAPAIRFTSTTSPSVANERATFPIKVRQMSSTQGFIRRSLPVLKVGVTMDLIRFQVSPSASERALEKNWSVVVTRCAEIVTKSSDIPHQPKNPKYATY